MAEMLALAARQGTRSPEEFAEAVRCLSPVEWGKLRRIAAAEALGGPTEGEDILQEAFARVLEERRPWPGAVNLVAFLAGVVRSIASAEEEMVGRSAARRPIPLFDRSGAMVVDPPDGNPPADKRLMEEEAAKETRRKITDTFPGDYDAQILVEGILEGLEGEELRGLTDLNPTAFASKRRLIKRRLTKLTPAGGTP
jgi:RNA polymerase sigma-70 factor (ECF subfamily)